MVNISLPRIVLDTGVLISLFNGSDPDHQAVKIGFVQLEQMHTRLIVPSCVVLETAKRLLFDVNPEAMQIATAAMLEDMEVLDTTQTTIEQAMQLIQDLNHRTATLEDAIVINTALTLSAPVWTINYRDFAAIKNLEFWNPK
jgi:predicted nucleic acid-binding protein